MILIQALLAWSVLRLVKNSVYLYNSEDSSSLEMYDCIFHKSWYYCRRPIEPIPLQRNNIVWQCHHNGIRHTFVNMKSKNITASIVTQKWSSTAEMAEKYARYMSKSVNSDRDHEQYICECKHPQSFGKYCEYFLPSGTTFSETLEWEGKMKNENEWKMQLYGDILCYTTLPCNSGLLCLDWRDICDGAQQCMSGYDEENCDKLEFNECEDDEYRCMNGMCIPDEYFLDGEYDCMDLTDEIGIFNDAVCTFQAVSSECDDRVCHPNQWSCGDGQCIKDRLAFQKEKPMSDECRNRREQYYMCETHYSLRLWTLPHGKCVKFNDDEELNVQNTTSIHKCEYFVKCALLRGLENNCLCQHNLSCSNKLENPCPLSTIQYPNGGILAPYVFHFYNTTRHWDTSIPDFIVINSTIKCRGYMSIQFETIPYRPEFPTRIIEDSQCNYASNSYTLDNTGYDRFCHNDSRTFNNRSYYFIDVCNISRECISAYRIQDGYENCVDRQDENRHDIVANTCSKLKRHRFQCSAQEPHCLSVNKLGDLWDDCKNKYDESWMGTETMLSKMKCNSKSKDDCLYIRQYIEASWNLGNDSGVSFNPAKKIPFRAYCDTFWDFLSKADENTSMCRTWSVCLDEQWRCRTGQCINPKWVMDGEWDCSDASDEEGIFVSNHSLLPRNLKLIKRSELEEKFNDLYSRQPFWKICNSTTEFPCFRMNMSFPFVNIKHDRPCISLDHVGDGHIDCIGALDERNTVEYCNRPTMLGRNFKCITNNICITYSLLCENRCPVKSDDEVLCYNQEKLSDCSEPTTDFRCLDGQCAKNGWCNDSHDCLYGEDEYLCDNFDLFQSNSSNAIYRSDKELNVGYDQQTFRLPHFPIDTNENKPIDKTFLKRSNRALNTSSLDIISLSVAYVCNRGVGVLMQNGLVACFCPQQYYGDRCQFHNDRITVKFHVNFSQSIHAKSNNSELVLKFLVLFLFEDQTLTSFEFHGRPTVELNTYTKKIDHVIYSRSNVSLQNKYQRYFNRSKIIHEHPYSIRVEAYEIKTNEKAQLVSVWQYPVYFDFLPSFRFAKVLRFIKLNTVVNPCLSSPCGRHKECHQLLNQNSSYVCLCPSDFTGSDCLTRDEICSEGFCSTNSLCKPTYRGVVNGNELPYCICPAGVFGLRCELVQDQCNTNPCQNDGKCFPSAMPGRYHCVCTSSYHGNECQLDKKAIRLYIKNSVEHRGAVVQYFNIDFFSLNLILVHQYAYDNLPDFLNYLYSEKTAPEIVVVKLYNNNQTKIYLISVHMNVQSVNGTTQASETNQCVHVNTLFETNEEISPFKYHRPCIRNETLLCFYDNNYLCICDQNYTRAECFGYNHNYDRCSNCRGGGLCLRSDKLRTDEYICICPQCYFGHSCQYNSQSFSFTLDQLFSADLLSNKLIIKQITFYSLIIGSWLVFIFGLINNLFSFITFRRPKCQCNGIGQYLFFMSIVNPINLGLLAARLTHIAINITYDRSDLLIDTVLCKLLNYFLIATSRITYWLVSLVAIERVYVTLFLNGQWLAKPYVARRFIAMTFVVILTIGAYELVFVTSHAVIKNGKSGICVFEFPLNQPVWETIHKVVSVINTVLPFLINLCCMVIISCVTVKKKIKVTARDVYTPTPTIVSLVIPVTTVHQASLKIKNSKSKGTIKQTAPKHQSRFQLLLEVLSEKKELIIGPAFTLVPQLFSMPLFLTSIMIACQNIETNQLRYLIIVSYCISFVPQLISFVLYISPSSFYLQQWRSTRISKYIAALRQVRRDAPSTTDAILSTVK